MFLIKILIWLSAYSIFYIIFSLNTIISIFYFIIIILLVCTLLLQIQVEYLTYLILLLYLGGILIFFLFTTLMLNNEYPIFNIDTQYSIKHTLFFLCIFKIFFFFTCLNFNLIQFKASQCFEYNPSFIENNYFINDFFKNQGDIIILINLYTEKSLLLLLLGLILLYTMMGVIVITRK